MDFLIIGGAGFIGSEIVKQLESENSVVFDNFSDVVHDNKSIKKFLDLGSKLHVGDVRNKSDINNLLNRLGVPKVLIYLTAETGTGRSLTNCSLNASVNTLGLANVLDAFSSINRFPEKVLLTSTRAVYGEGPYINENKDLIYPPQRKTEMLFNGKFEYEGLSPVSMDASKHFANPNNIYGSTKLSQEHLLRSWAAAYEVPATIFRLQNVYGAGQSLTNPYTGVLIHFIKQSMNGKPIEIFENGGITRDFVHVSDVASLLVTSIRNSARTGTFDCGSGRRLQLYDVAEILARMANAPVPIISNAYRPGDVRHACASIERTCSEFDWLPKIDLNSGLSSLFDFVKDNI